MNIFPLRGPIEPILE